MGALDDGRLPLDDNLAERGIKPLAIGRKNFLFSDTPRGAETSAGMYSIMVTTKTNGLNPRKYVQWLLEEMPNAADPGDPAYLDSLMPWPQSAPTGIRLKPKAAEEAARMANDPIIVGHPRRQGIAETSRSFLNRNGKTPRGLSFYTLVMTLTAQEVHDKLNRRPRKRLGYLTPHEIHCSEVLRLI